jgi:hypothetical protein
MHLRLIKIAGKPHHRHESSTMTMTFDPRPIPSGPTVSNSAFYCSKWNHLSTYFNISMPEYEWFCSTAQKVIWRVWDSKWDESDIIVLNLSCIFRPGEIRTVLYLVSNLTNMILMTPTGATDESVLAMFICTTHNHNKVINKNIECCR